MSILPSTRRRVRARFPLTISTCPRCTQSFIRTRRWQQQCLACDRDETHAAMGAGEQLSLFDQEVRNARA